MNVNDCKKIRSRPEIITNSYCKEIESQLQWFVEF